MQDAVRRIFASEAVRGQSAVFLSQVMLNVTLFGVVFLASILFDTAEFAKLSLALGWINVLATVLSFGLDGAALKLAFERRNFAFVAVNICLKGFLLSVMLVGSLLAAFAFARTTEAVVASAAAAIAFWMATRVVEQYKRGFLRLAVLNLALAASRLLVGGFSMTMKSWEGVVLALHVAAQLPIHIFTFVTTMRELRREADFRLVVPMLRIAPIMFGSIALFSSLPVIAQQTMFNRGDLVAAAAFGVVLLFVAPIAIIITTLRVYLLPRVLDADAPGEAFDRISRTWSLVILVAVAAAVAIVARLVLPLIYGTRQPLVAEFAMFYLSTYVLVSGIGIFNLKAQRGGLIVLELAVNVVRSLATLLMCVLVRDPMQIVIYASAILLAGECLLFACLAVHDRRRRASTSDPEP